MNDNNATFGHDTNKITIIRSDFSQKEFALKSKDEVAKDIGEAVNELWLKRKMNGRPLNLN
ncbi:MAG: hypothetical protein ABI691_13065 [Ginsengibacter sp.]